MDTLYTQICTFLEHAIPPNPSLTDLPDLLLHQIIIIIIIMQRKMKSSLFLVLGQYNSGT